MSPNLRIQCPACKSTLEAGVSHAGEKIRCLKCGQKLLVPIPPNTNNKTVLAPMVETATLIVDAAPTPGAAPGAVVALPKPMPPPIPEILPDADPSGRAQVVGFALAALAAIQSRSRMQSILEWRRPLMANTLWPALLLFFLPWTNLSCNDRVLIRQSGFQSCYGGATPTAYLQGMMERNGDPAKRKGGPDSLPLSPLSWMFALCLATGIVSGLGCMIALATRLRIVAIALEHVALLAGSACFLLLVVQMVFGFPLERQLHQENEKTRQQRKQDRDARAQFGDPNRGFDEAGALAADALVGIDVQYSVWLWATLFFTFLSVPLLLAESAVTTVGLLRRRRMPLISTAAATALALGVTSATQAVFNSF